MHAIVFNKEVYVRSISISFMTNALPSVEADAVASMPQEEIDAAVRTAGAKREAPSPSPMSQHSRTPNVPLLLCTLTLDRSLRTLPRLCTHLAAIRPLGRTARRAHHRHDLSAI